MLIPIWPVFPAFITLPGGPEWIVLLVLGLLIFGRRLPEVGRSLGRGIVEFKRGIKGIEDEIESESNRSGGGQSGALPESDWPNAKWESEQVAPGNVSDKSSSS